MASCLAMNQIAVLGQACPDMTLVFDKKVKPKVTQSLYFIQELLFPRRQTLLVVHTL